MASIGRGSLGRNGNHTYLTPQRCDDDVRTPGVGTRGFFADQRRNYAIPDPATSPHSCAGPWDHTLADVPRDPHSKVLHLGVTISGVQRSLAEPIANTRAHWVGIAPRHSRRCIRGRPYRTANVEHEVGNADASATAPLERRTVWMGSVVITGVSPLYSTTIVLTHSQQVPAEHGGRVGDGERNVFTGTAFRASRPVRARKTSSRPGLVTYLMTPMAARDGGGVPGEMLTWWPVRPRSARGARTRSRRLDAQLLTRRASGEDPR
jgi:hypothetical protein